MKKTSKKLFQHVLDVGKNNEASVMLFGDMHYGYPTCILSMIQDTIKYCLERHIYLIGMGDYIECGTKDSPGDSLFIQRGNAQTQMDFIIELFKPLAQEGLMLGLHTGNHENRAFKILGIDLVKNICRELSHQKKEYSCRNFGYTAYHLIRVGKESYDLFTTHGVSGARTPETKMRAVRRFGEYVDAEVIAMGHLHDISTTCFDHYTISKKHESVMWRKQYYVLTGSYLGHEGSYAEAKGMIPGTLGSPKIRFLSDKHDIFISF